MCYVKESGSRIISDGDDKKKAARQQRLPSINLSVWRGVAVWFCSWTNPRAVAFRVSESDVFKLKRKLANYELPENAYGAYRAAAADVPAQICLKLYNGI